MGEPSWVHMAYKRIISEAFADNQFVTTEALVTKALVAALERAAEVIRARAKYWAEQRPEMAVCIASQLELEMIAQEVEALLAPTPNTESRWKGCSLTMRCTCGNVYYHEGERDRVAEDAWVERHHPHYTTPEPSR